MNTQRANDLPVDENKRRREDSPDYNGNETLEAPELREDEWPSCLDDIE